MIKYLLPALLGLTLISCEGNTDRVRLIDNQSSSELNVEKVTYWSSGTLTIAEGETKEFYSASQLGGSDYIVHPASGIDTLIITNAVGDTCTKNYLDSLAWEYTVTERSRIPADWLHEYTFIVTDEDF